MSSQVTVERKERRVADPAKPLDGLRIVITRAAEQARGLTARLEKLGASVMLVPAVSFSEPDDWAPVDRAIAGLSEFDWVLLTSANAARFFAGRCKTKGVNPRGGRPRYAAIGAATAHAAAAEGFMVSYTARTFSGAALARELGPAMAGKQVLLPRSERAAPDLPNLVTDGGAQVSQVIVYKTGGMSNLPRELSEAMRNGDFDVLTFFSPSAVENFRNEVGAEVFSRIAKTAVLAAIGPVTSAALRRHGVKAAIEPKQATAEAMAAAIAAYFERQEKKPGKS